MKFCRWCGHIKGDHRQPVWFWRRAARWRHPWPFACRATIWNGARTVEARCVCRGWVCR